MRVRIVQPLINSRVDFWTKKFNYQLRKRHGYDHNRTVRLIGVHVRIHDREDWFAKFVPGGRPFEAKHILHFMGYALEHSGFKAEGQRRYLVE